MIKNHYRIKSLTLFLFFLLSSRPVFAGWPDHGMMYGGYQMMGGGMVWMMFLFWGLVLGILLLVIRWVVNLSKKDGFYGTQKKAIDILKERLAKGEISIAEFESKKQILSD